MNNYCLIKKKLTKIRKRILLNNNNKTKFKKAQTKKVPELKKKISKLKKENIEHCKIYNNRRLGKSIYNNNLK